MALIIVEGGTLNGVDGTSYSNSGDRTNMLTYTALNTAVDAHYRSNLSAEYCASGDIYVVFGASGACQLSLNGGSTWDGGTSSAVPLPEFSYINKAISFRQTATATNACASFTTSGTFTATTTLDNVTGFTATTCSGASASAAIDGDKILLVWTTVSNNSGYLIDWRNATSSGSLTASGNASAYTHSALVNGSAYVYSIKADGSGRYVDSTASAASSATLVNFLFRDEFATGTDWSASWLPNARFDHVGTVTDGSASLSNSAAGYGHIALATHPTIPASGICNLVWKQNWTSSGVDDLLASVPVSAIIYLAHSTSASIMYIANHSGALFLASAGIVDGLSNCGTVLTSALTPSTMYEYHFRFDKTNNSCSITQDGVSLYSNSAEGFLDLVSTPPPHVPLATLDTFSVYWITRVTTAANLDYVRMY